MIYLFFDLPRVQQVVEKIEIPTTVSPRPHVSPSNVIPHVDSIPEVTDSSFSPPECVEQDETNTCLPNDDDVPSISHSHNAHDDTNISNIDGDATVITWIQCESCMQWRKLSNQPDNIDNWTCYDNVEIKNNKCTDPD